MRDDFSEHTKRTLAERVNWTCSYPDCNQVTVGPHSDNNKRINIGHACHIEAASENGPRYNPMMSVTERKSIENGIWMCRNHSGLIDADSNTYTVEQLRKWKLIAERKASVALRQENMGEKQQNFYASNVLAHRDKFSEIKDIEYFKLYKCMRSGVYYLKGAERIAILIKDSSIAIYFNRELFRPCDGKEYQYIKLVKVSLWRVIDLVVSAHDCDESLNDFIVEFEFKNRDYNETYFTIGSRTQHATYGPAYYFIRQNTILNDVDEQIYPAYENLYFQIISECESIYNMIVKL